ILYVTLFPCNECAKAIIQSGIKQVIYLDNKYAGTDGVRASEQMFKLSGVKFEQYQKSKQEIIFDL
ncbi:MAG: cytidine deaminase, partial [Oscillospiraceae bacterium]|nr:cytidine deaminase [Oscillospiraceae bacterium]